MIVSDGEQRQVGAVRLSVLRHECYLRNRSALAVNCWVIIHCLEVICKVDQREARVIYLLTTDRQTVIYYSTIHALELIYFDSNTQKTIKKQLESSDSSSFPPLHKEIPPTILPVIQAFKCEKTTLHRLTSWKWKLTSPKIKMASERR